MISNRYVLMFVSLLVIVVILTIANKMYFVVKEVEHFHTRSWDESPWALSQAQLELERMRLALYKARLDKSLYPQVQQRIEIFWSRLDVLAVGPNQGVLRRDPQLRAVYEQANDFLNTHSNHIDQLSPTFIDVLVQESQLWSNRWQQMARPIFLWRTQHLSMVNQRISSTFYEVVLLSFLVIVLVLGLCWVLWRLLCRHQLLLIQANAVNRIKDDFITHMNHELRTPLNGIIATISLLKQQDQHDNELITILDVSSDALLKQINAVLDYSQLSKQPMNMELEDVYLHDFFKACVQLFKVQAQQKGLHIELYCAEPSNVMVVIDQQKLRQILLNLIANAIKFTQYGSVLVIYQLQGDANDRQLVVDVKDTGIGIKPESLEHIFSSFSQADSSIKRQFGGNGLGLTISKSLLNCMQGTITVQSTAHSGSIFSIKLPVRVSQAKDHIAAIDRQFDKQSLLGKTVLLAEDNLVNQQIASKILKKIGVSVHVVSNGQQAVDFPLSDIDLIFMDIQMPILDGLAATEQLIKSGVRIPIIALTANATEADKQRCLHLGMVDCIRKPYNFMTIEKTLHSYLS